MPAPENRFKTALAGGAVQYGCWAGFADAYATEVLATAGFDWLVIDAEHAPNDLRSIMAQLQVLEGRHSAPVVRLPMGEPWAIKQVLDAGAQTLLIPLVECGRAGPRDLARAMRYPPTRHPRRRRGAWPAPRAFSGIRRLRRQPPNDQVCLLVQVETRAGLAALDEILRRRGRRRRVFVGPCRPRRRHGAFLGDSAPTRRWPAAIRDALARIAASGQGSRGSSPPVDDASALRYRGLGRAASSPSASTW